MSYADRVFKEICRNILDHGVMVPEGKARTRWADGSEARYSSIHNVQHTYDVEKEFPVITLRKNMLKSSVEEILWIYQKKSNNIHDLSSHIWDQWADKEGSIGKAYGYQLAQKYKVKVGDRIVYMDQVDKMFHTLKTDPYSRRNIVTLYNPHDLADMALQPCAYLTHWYVENDKLNMTLIQRSQDMLVANGWNTMQYAALLCMVASSAGYGVGLFTHCIGDAHIYDRHMPIVEDLLASYENPAPKVTYVKRDNFYDYTQDDFTIENYVYSNNLKNIEVAA